METRLNHALDLEKTRDSRSRERFVSSLRSYVLNDLASEMRGEYEQNLLPNHLKGGGSEPANGEDVHEIMKPASKFRFYSSLRCTAQELVWNTVADSIDSGALADMAGELSREAAENTLILSENLQAPDYAETVDVHLMPGNYQGHAGSTVEPGALYDNGLNVFAFGAMGRQLNDIGWSMANFYRARFPDASPRRIVDVGCTIGHNTLPWKETFPEAHVTGIDLAAGALRYAHARATALGVEATFVQGSADALPQEDNSVDVVFSSMFLHELPLEMIQTFLREAHRVLRPGGVLLNMELPPNGAMAPYDAFYLDWDGHYNSEPFYQDFRDQDYRQLVVDGGFSGDTFFEGVMPRFTYVDEEDFRRAVSGEAHFDEDTGRLSDGIQWYGFGGVKGHE